MLLSCVAVYLVIAVPVWIMIWATLIAAKSGDGVGDEDDLENNALPRIEFIELKLKKRHS